MNDSLLKAMTDKQARYEFVKKLYPAIKYDKELLSKEQAEAADAIVLLALQFWAERYSILEAYVK